MVSLKAQLFFPKDAWRDLMEGSAPLGSGQKGLGAE